MFGGGEVGRIDLSVVVASSGQRLERLIGEIGHHGPEPRIRPEEVLANVGPGLGGVLLEVAVDRRVHLLEEDPVHVLGQQLIPVASPHHFDHIPSRPTEQRFELLDDFAIASDRPIESLEVAVHDEREVVEVLPPGHAQATDGLRLIQFAVADEAPHPAG